MKPKIKALVTAYIAPVQSLEDAARQLRDERYITNAIDTALDGLGSLVGEKRQGRTNDDYRRFAQARIAANRSSGTVDELIAIARLVLGVPTAQIVVRTIGRASFIVEVRDLPIGGSTVTALLALLTRAVDSGVRIVLVWSSVPLSATFRLDSGPGLDVGVLANGIDRRGTP